MQHFRSLESELRKEKHASFIGVLLFFYVGIHADQFQSSKPEMSMKKVLKKHVLEQVLSA